MVRVRFAPSPTGYLHIGNARTALFNWLFARANKGSFILRIEDTDIERSKEDYVERIMFDLEWLGLAWDEGPKVGGKFGPYKQSERSKLYKEHADRLLKEGRAYHCYCSDEELNTRKREARKLGKTPRYDNRCRKLSAEEIKGFKDKGIKPAIRFKVPQKTVIVNDIVRGEVSFDTSLMGDFVIMKSTDTPSFNFAVVCDDTSMKITHIIRGEDHLSNTPKHILLFEALGVTPPCYAHMSLTMAPGGERLSKRTGATSISYYRDEGYLPEALINYLALLGWSPGDDREVMPPQEMMKEFKLEKLSKSSEAFDPTKLDWMSGLYIRQAKIDRLTTLSLPFLEKAGFIKGKPSKAELERIKRIVFAVRDHLSHISEISSYVETFFSDTINIKEKDAKEILKRADSKKVLEAFQKELKEKTKIEEGDFKPLIKSIEKKTNLKGKMIYQPLRVAITGKLHGPELKIIIPILGMERCIKRINQILK